MVNEYRNNLIDQQGEIFAFVLGGRDMTLRCLRDKYSQTLTFNASPYDFWSGLPLVTDTVMIDGVRRRLIRIHHRANPESPIVFSYGQEV